MEGNHEGTERRRDERIACAGVFLTYRKSGFLTKLLGLKAGWGRPVPVRNITRNGLCFLSRDALEPGQQVTMAVKLAHKKPPVRVEAQVVWRDTGDGMSPFVVGVSFVKMSPRVRKVLDHVDQVVVRRKGKDSAAWRFRAREHRNKMWGTLDGR